MSSVLQNWSVTSAASLEDVIQVLCSQKATACAVIHGATNDLIGIVTESDVVVACQDCASAGRTPTDTTVASILTPRKLERGVLENALPSSEIYMEFAIQMGMAKSKHLPIVTADDKFVGIMTASAAVKQILLNDRSSADWLAAATRSLDLSDTAVGCIEQSTSIMDAVKRMRKGKKALVVTPTGQLAQRTMSGLVTVSDVLRRAIAKDPSRMVWMNKDIASIMTPAGVVKTMSEDDADIVTSLEQMITHGFRHMPVVQDRGTLDSLVGGLKSILTFGLGSREEPLHQVCALVGIDDILQAVARKMLVEQREDKPDAPEVFHDLLHEDDSLSARSGRSDSLHGDDLECAAEICLTSTDSLSWLHKTDRLVKRLTRRADSLPDPDKLQSMIQPVRACLLDLAGMAELTAAERCILLSHQAASLIQLLTIIIAAQETEAVCVEWACQILHNSVALNDCMTSSSFVAGTYVKVKNVGSEYTELMVEILNFECVLARVLAGVAKLVVAPSFCNYGKVTPDVMLAAATLSNLGRICTLLNKTCVDRLAAASDGDTLCKTATQIVQAAIVCVNIVVCHKVSMSESAATSQVPHICMALAHVRQDVITSITVPGKISALYSEYASLTDCCRQYLRVLEPLQSCVMRRLVECRLSSHVRCGIATAPSDSEGQQASVFEPAQIMEYSQIVSALSTLLSLQVAYTLSVKAPSLASCIVTASNYTSCGPHIDSILRDKLVLSRKTEWLVPTEQAAAEAVRLASSTSDIQASILAMQCYMAVNLFGTLSLAAEVIIKAPTEMLGGDLGKGELIGKAKVAKQMLGSIQARLQSTIEKSNCTAGNLSSQLSDITKEFSDRLLSAMARSDSGHDENLTASAVKTPAPTARSFSAASRQEL